MDKKQMAANYLENIKKYGLLGPVDNPTRYKIDDKLGVGLMCCSPSLVRDESFYTVSMRISSEAGGQAYFPIRQLDSNYALAITSFREEFSTLPSTAFNQFTPEEIKERMEAIANEHEADGSELS